MKLEHMQHDRLFQLMILRLQREDLPKESKEEFIKEIVGSYMAELMEVGHIPYYLLDEVSQDLTGELTEMFRKKTYGSVSLPDFKERKKLRRTSKAG